MKMISMIKKQKFFKNISNIFKKNKGTQISTSKTVFDSRISKINIILDSSENAQERIIPEPTIPAANIEHSVTPDTEPPVSLNTEAPVHTKPELPVHTISKPLIHHRFKSPASLNTEPLIHTKPEPPVHTEPKLPITRRDATVSPKTKHSVTPKPEHPIHTQTEPLVQKSTDPYKKGMQEINKLKLQLEQMEISRKASSKKYK